MYDPQISLQRSMFRAVSTSPMIEILSASLVRRPGFSVTVL